MPSTKSSPTVPMSKHQLGSQEACFENLSPGSGELHSALCTILELYEQATFEQEEVPQDIAKDLKAFPNKLYAKIRLEDGRILFRPFRDPQSQIFSTYGNAAVLKGTPAKIFFHNTRVREGQIVCIDNPVLQPVNLPLAVEAWDIGVLV